MIVRTVRCPLCGAHAVGVHGNGNLASHSFLLDKVTNGWPQHRRERQVHCLASGADYQTVVDDVGTFGADLGEEVPS